MKISPLKLKDIPQALKIFQLESDVFKDRDLKNVSRQLRRSLSSDKSEKYFVAKDRNAIVSVTGYCQDSDGLGTYELGWTVVHPKYQRQGVGRELLKALEQILKKRHAKILFLKTSSTNMKAIAFYLKNDFQKVGVIPKFFGEKDMLILYKDLSE